EVDQLELAAYYEFSSNFIAYTAYSFAQISGADDVVRLALRYDF
ncbi:MAG: porin, partial [Gammaproteobacteria bacterium]|nr:porin [Gammaproteobacteria bacterium]